MTQNALRLSTRRRARIAVLILLWPSILLAQTEADKNLIRQATQTESLAQKAKELAAEASQKQAAAHAKARAEGWPIEQVTPDGRYIKLIELDNQGRPVYYTTFNVNAAISTRTNLIQTGGAAGYNLDGTDIIIGEWDGGSVLSTHQQFSGRISNMNSAFNNDHATHVCGTMIGDGTGNSSAKGMAPKATVASYDWNQDAAEMSAEAASGMLLSNHSYGTVAGWTLFSDGWYWYGNPDLSNTESYFFGWYNDNARSWDQIAHDAPYYLIVKAAGNDRGGTAPAGASYRIWNKTGTFVNSGSTAIPRDGGTDGYDCIPTAGVAKNILTVGAVNDMLSYTDRSSVTMSTFSGWGPTDDGRIKPDIVGNGVTVTSSLSSSNSAYASYNGTSMASPNITGSCALLQQLYYRYYNRYMYASTLKALVLHTADDAGRPGPDYAFGWGIMNSRRAADQIADSRCNPAAITESILNAGGKYTRTIRASGGQPLIVTIVWTDPAGDAIPDSYDNTTPNLVNDLDIRLISSSTTHSPYILDPSKPSQDATTGDNFRDNVEKIYLDNPTAGTKYTVQVSHKGLLIGAQKFSLIISGATAETIVEDSLPTAILGLPYSYTMAEGELGRLVWKAAALPEGLTLDTLNGRLNGTPTRSGKFDIAFSVRKNNCTYAKTVRLTVEASTTWNGTFWDHGRPDSTLHAILAADYFTSSHDDIAARSLTINSGVSLILHPEGIVSIVSLLDNQGIVDNCHNGKITYQRLKGSSVETANQPPSPATLVLATPLIGNRLLIEYAIGTGQKRMVVVKEGRAVADRAALIGEEYTANTIYGQSPGPDSSFVVLNGSENSVIASGFRADRDYFVSVFEYNVQKVCGPVYSLAAHGSPTTGLEAGESIRLYPNPVSDKLRIETQTGGSIRFMTAEGRIMHQSELITSVSFDLSLWPRGLYFVEFITTSGTLTQKLILE